MKCCPECFGDRFLRKEILYRSTETGQCSYCNSVGINILEPSAIAEYFELLASAYHPAPEGKLLVELFREEWGVFGNSTMTDARTSELIGALLNDSEVILRKYSPTKKSGVDRVGEWESLRNELMYKNRFFPDSNIDLERLEELIGHLKLDSDEIPNVWYRARIIAGEEGYGAADMGAPPKRNASHGRANPAGIPYLYVGSTPETAISEIRPHTGEIACVADFKTMDDLQLIDLRDPKRMVSPFLLPDADSIRMMRSDLPFLERLGDELTRPVVPHAAAIDYTPSQYVCEFIKKCGYDGVIYRSSVSDGINMALFYPKKAQVGTVSMYKVSRVTVDSSPIQ